MKRVSVLLLALLLCAPAWAGDTLHWPTPYPSSGHYTKHHCALCDKRIHKWHDSSTMGGRGGSVIFSENGGGYVIIPSRNSAVTLDPDISLIVCEKCEKEWSGRYRATMKVHMDEFINNARDMNKALIEQHQKDNSVYKEKQDEIERLRRKIQELEMNRDLENLKSGTSGMTIEGRIK